MERFDTALDQQSIWAKSERAQAAWKGTSTWVVPRGISPNGTRWLRIKAAPLLPSEPKSFHTIFAYYSPMGNERASTTRQRETGIICCRCHALLPPVYHERYCKACEPRHRIYMHFQNAKQGWRVTFLEQDLKTPLARVFIFQDPAKIAELAARGGADNTLADRQALEHGISIGRGGVSLNLTPAQYKTLKSP